MSLSRGRFPARLSLPDLDPAVLEHYRLLWRGEDLHANLAQFPALTAATLFGRAAPLEIDIGCATGEFIVGLAADHPERRFLGVEISRKPIEHAVAKAVARGLDNIRFLQADMILAAALLAPQTVGAIYIHFPVPFTTTRKRKHYTYAPRLLTIYRNALVTGGRLSFVSDDQRVAAEITQAVTREAGFAPVAEADWQLALSDHLRSPYQRLWAQRKRTIWRAEFERTADMK
ncbi:MAG: methyltransferase domain-containing protein [Roseiflexaceae bacterium]|nr:methyltransferase domain-containing protein [Roseiflexaceae bacterium]